MFDVSVVVVTYNPIIDNLICTLRSIIVQKDISFEIIVADDGSAVFDENLVKNWFSENNFSNYKIVINKKNMGTMKNAYSGWSVAEGKYIKQLSPGDYLYNDLVLKKAFTLMESKNAGLCFGLAASYRIDEDGINIVDRQNPLDLEPYLLNDINGIKYNYLVLKDYANGMTFLADRKLILKYGAMLLDKVKYAEDCTYVLMIGDDVSIVYMDDYMIWYEYGTGISTEKNNVWSKRITDDNYACFKVLGEIRPEYKYLYKTFSMYSDGVFQKTVKRLLRIILNKNFSNKKKKHDTTTIASKNKADLIFLNSIIQGE